jgi:hypothetical protein
MTFSPTSAPSSPETQERGFDQRLGLFFRTYFRPLRGGFRDWPGHLMRAHLLARWRNRAPGRPHGLAHPLIVSLTSYPARFDTLALSLKCLLTQSIRPDRIVLWVAHRDFAALPPDVLALRREGLDIERTEDTRSFKKLIPALKAHQDALIVTADDDVCYPAHWLEQLIATYDPQAREVLATRVHRIVLDADGLPAPYLEWIFNIDPGPAHPLNMATGVGGVLYPPGSLHAEVFDRDAFMKLCPLHDDLWFYFMARRAGWSVRKVGPRSSFISWPSSQRIALQHANVGDGGADLQLARLIRRFGAPFASQPLGGVHAPSAVFEAPRP